MTIHFIWKGRYRLTASIEGHKCAINLCESMTSLTYFWQKAKYRVENLAVSKETDTKWNSSTNSGTVPQFEEPRTVSQKCGTALQKVEQVLKSGHCSTNCGTVPQCVEKLLLKVEQVQWTARRKSPITCYFKMWYSVPL